MPHAHIRVHTTYMQHIHVQMQAHVHVQIHMSCFVFLIHTSIGSCTVFGFLIRLLKVSVIKRFMANYSQNS